MLAILPLIVIALSWIVWNVIYWVQNRKSRDTIAAKPLDRADSNSSR